MTKACYLRAGIPTILLCLLTGTEAFSQIVEKNDSIPASRVWGTRGRQKTVSERLITLDDVSHTVSIVGEGDVSKVILTLPGVASGADGSASYYVRGGNMGDNIQTLDGVPVYGCSHLVGLTTPYSSDIINSSSFQVGGYTSDDSNLSSSHIKISSKDGSFDHLSAKFDISPLLTGGTISGPVVKDRLSLNASVRYSPAPYLANSIADRMDSVITGFSKAGALIYDAYAKLKYMIGPRKSISLSTFRSQDKYIFLLDNDSEDKMSWENFIANMQYDSPWRERGRFTANASFNHYSNSQGMFKQMDRTSNNLLVCSILDEGVLQAKVNTYGQGQLAFQYGIKARMTRFRPGSSRIIRSTGLYPKTSSPMSDKSVTSYTGVLHGQVEYGSYEKNLFRTAGRINYNDISGIIPEASVLARVRLYENLGIEITGDYLTKFYHTLEGAPLGWSLDMIIPTSEQFKPEHVTQVYTGLFTDKESHHLSVGAYYKKASNLVWFADASKLFDSSTTGWEQNIKTGSGTSRGLEFMYEKTGENTDWRISYTLSKTDRLFADLNRGEAFPSKYDRRHILNATTTTRLITNGHFLLSLSGLFTYQSGHRETVISGYWWDDNFITGPTEVKFYTSLNNYRMPEYIRCDIGATLEFPGRKCTQLLNLGVYNVFNRHNPFSLSYDPDTGQWSQISLLPIMPCIKYSVNLFYRK